MQLLDGRIEILQGDITKLDVDAIVNAANNQLLRGGGVCGAIHAAAGPELEAACRALGGCETGDAKITQGYGLPAKHVIHAVGPVWQGGTAGEERLLAGAYRASLDLAEAHGFKSLAFPAISTGIFGFPVERATRIALTTVWEHLHRSPAIERVFLVCFDQATLEIYRRAATSMDA
ncbi:MAG: O-acetyl-ADP-ribose deacetylase [Alphaproteobacteria bacterium]|nr:O-acetyl-ADP-ribose deacetylase [Alphaproteobacteria bacterium]